MLAAHRSRCWSSFDASVNRLIPLYAFGVFLSFTLSQSGMVVHWLRVKGGGWKSSIVINSIGAVDDRRRRGDHRRRHQVRGGRVDRDGGDHGARLIFLWTIYQHYSRRANASSTVRPTT